MSSTIAVLEKLRQGFVSELPEKIDEIEEHILACVEGGDFEEEFQEAYRKTHSLKGTGGTFGIPILTSICHQLEDVLTLWETESFGVAGTHQARCLDYVDLLRQASDILIARLDDFSFIGSRLRELQDIDFKGKLRVLLVDGSRTTREICKQTISEYNADVVEMADGYESLSRLLHERFDVLIAGKEIGLLNGHMLISVVSQLQSDTHSITTILITSSKQERFAKKRSSDPTAVVNKGVAMVSELEAQFDALSARGK